MMNFKNIRKYPTYESYTKIKKLKYQQAFAAFKKVYKRSDRLCKPNTSQGVMDKKAGFVCCESNKNCCYCVNGVDLSGNNCANPPTGDVCCGCPDNPMIVKNNP